MIANPAADQPTTGDGRAYRSDLTNPIMADDPTRRHAEEGRSPMASTTETPKRRSRFAISLRILMLLVLLAALPMGWKVNRAHTQRRAVAAIRAANQDVRYDFQRSGAIEPPGPAWLRRLVGDEYFQEVVHVTLRSDDPKVMAAVGQLDRLEYLNIDVLQENAGNALAEIGRLKRLQDLSLYGAFGLRDDMLASLDGLPELFRSRPSPGRCPSSTSWICTIRTSPTRAWRRSAGSRS
jgi:hypothetical protein